MQPYGRTSWRAGKEMLVPALGRGTKSLLETRSQREETLIQNFASCLTVFSVHGTQRGTAGKQGLAWLPGTAVLSHVRKKSFFLSAWCTVRALHSAAFPSLHTLVHTFPLLIYPNLALLWAATLVLPILQNQEDKVCSSQAATETQREQSSLTRSQSSGSTGAH